MAKDGKDTAPVRHLVVTLPEDDAAALLMFLTEKTGLDKVRRGRWERADGATVTEA